MSRRRQICQTLGSTTCELHRGLSRWLIDHAHISPEYALAHARAKRLGAGFLGGEALGVRGGAQRPAVGLPALNFCEKTIQKTLAIALD